MRCFIAIEFDDETKKFLVNIQDKLKSYEITGNYSRPENLHLTIRFLGVVDQYLFKAVKDAMKRVALRHNSFDLNINSIGKFDKGNKSIVWAGLESSPALLKLYNDMDEELRAMMPALNKEKYSPHITLIREAGPKDKVSSFISDMGDNNHRFTVSGISLMESTRINGQLTYIRKAYETIKPNE